MRISYRELNPEINPENSLIMYYLLRKSS